MAGKDVSISYADGSGRAARGEDLALCLGGRNNAKVMQAFNAALSITDEETAASSLAELRRKPYPSLAPLAKMQKVISIHDPRVLNVSVVPGRQQHAAVP